MDLFGSETTTETHDPYRVLARKYRPAGFADLIGQEAMVRTLDNAFEVGRIPRFILLTGVRGVGKTTTARILARAMNHVAPGTDKPTTRPTEEGEHDRAIMEGRHPDVIEIDGASHTGVDAIRELVSQVRYKPDRARYRTYVIDEVHMLSSKAFSALEQGMETAPEHSIFILATTDDQRIPIGVSSRCMRFSLRRIGPDDMIPHLRRILEAEGVEYEAEVLPTVAMASEGSMRDALSLLDQAIANGRGRLDQATVSEMMGLADRGRVVDLFEMAMRGDVASAMKECASRFSSGAEPAAILADLVSLVETILEMRLTGKASKSSELAPSDIERGLDFSRRLSFGSLNETFAILSAGMPVVRSNAKPHQALDMLLVHLVHAPAKSAASPE